MFMEKRRKVTLLLKAAQKENKNGKIRE